MLFQRFVEPKEVVAAKSISAPTVSVIMPTYCRLREGLLTRAIDSVLGQTYRDFEFIIVDDGSSDGSEGVCLAYAARDPRIVYVRHDENCGLPAVRVNEAIMMARGSQIAFVFDDNQWFPDVLETLVRHMESRPADVVYSNMEIMLGGGKKCVLGGWPLSVELLMHLNTIPNGGVLCQKTFFEQYGMYDPHLILRRICDWDLWLRGLALGATFSHCDKVTGREYGPASPASLGNSVQWDYKTSYAYMACGKQMKSRSDALRPATIGAYDVFDPERVVPYLRDFQEWEFTEKVVYEGFFSKHPDFSYPKPVRHNRRYDTASTGYKLNDPHDVFHERLRILIVSNRCDRLVEEWKASVASQLGAIALSCAEWQASAYNPCDIDLLVLCDCTSPYLPEVVRGFAQAGVPITYCTVHGKDTAPAAGRDPLNYLDWSRHPEIVGVLGAAMYYPLPGLPWDESQQSGAGNLIALAHQVLQIGDKESLPPGSMATAVEFISNRIGPELPSPPAPLHGHHLPAVAGEGSTRKPVCTTIFLGDVREYSSETLRAVGQWIERAYGSRTFQILVSNGSQLPSEFKSIQDRLLLVQSNQPIARLATDLTNTCLLVPDRVLQRHSAFHQSLMEEDLAHNGSALASLESTLQDAPAEDCEAWLAARVSASIEACRQRGAASRPDARALHWANLALAGVFVGGRVRAAGKKYDPRKINVFVNSQLVGGSESVGLLLSHVLTTLGFDARICIPQDNVFADQDDSDLNGWLRERGLPQALKASHSLGSQCLSIAPDDALKAGAKVSRWLDDQGVGTVIGSAFISELALGPASDRLTYLGLMQPWGHQLNEMSFLRDRVAGIFSDSRWSTAEWARWMAPIVAWLPSVVEPKHFSQRQPTSTGRVRIAVGGTFQPRKRQLEALQAVRELVLAGHDVELNFYGYELDMLKEYVGGVRTLAQEKELRGRVAFHGLVDMATLIRDNDIFLVSSIDESIPQTLLFGMAGGLVPVACPCGGVSELVQNGKTGVLAAGFAVADMSKALKDALAARSQWPQLVAAGRAALIEEYSEPIVANRLMRFLLQGAAIATSPGRTRFAVHQEPREETVERIVAEESSVPALRRTRPARTAANCQLWNGPEVGRRGVRYRLRCNEDQLSGLKWCLNTSLAGSCGKLKLKIVSEPSGAVIREVAVDLSSSLDRQWVEVQFPPIANSRERDFIVLASTDILEGQCTFCEPWPHVVSRYRILSSRIQKRLGKYLGVRLSREFSPFFPLYGQVH